MKKAIFILIIFFVSAVFAQADKTKSTKTLFERLGGKEGITKIVDDVVETHMKNDAIKARFLPYKKMPERLGKIKKHIVNFFSAGSGGNVQYKGRDMPSAHRGMNISREEYMHVIDDILLVLNKHKIDEESQKDVLLILWSLKETIVEK